MPGDANQIGIDRVIERCRHGTLEPPSNRRALELTVRYDDSNRGLHPGP